MTTTELENKIKVIEKTYLDQMTKVQIDFALSNNPFKVGDIINAGWCIICIEKIGHYTSITGRIACTYFGKRLKKDLTPFKSSTSELVYQNARCELIKRK